MLPVPLIFPRYRYPSALQSSLHYFTKFTRTRWKYLFRFRGFGIWRLCTLEYRICNNNRRYTFENSISLREYENFNWNLYLIDIKNILIGDLASIVFLIFQTLFYIKINGKFIEKIRKRIFLFFSQMKDAYLKT